MAIINFPFMYVPDPNVGRPLFNGQVFVGEPDLDPEIPANQKQLRIVQEDGTLIDVGQPFLLSAGGTPIYNGSAVRLDVEGNFSIKILSSQGAQSYYVHNVLEGEPLTNRSKSAAYQYVAVDAMKADPQWSSTDAGKIVQTSEHTSGYGYQGGNTYIIQVVTAGPDDNGSLIKSTGSPAIEFVGLFPGGVNAMQFGASPLAADSSAAIQAAFDHSSTVVIPKNTYVCGSNFTVASGADVRSDGATLDFSSKSSKAQCVSATGSVGSYLSVTADISIGDVSFELSSGNAATLSQGDMLFLRSEEKENPSVENKTGEIAYVESVSSTTVTVQEKIRNSYTTANTASVAKVTPVENITISGLNFIGTAFQHPTGGGGSWQNSDGDHGITVTYGKNILIENCKFNDVVRMSVRINSCDQWKIRDCQDDNPQEQSTTQIIYGICWLDYASNGSIEGCHIYRGRHGIVNSDSSGYGVGYNVTVDGNVVNGTYVAALSTHSSCRNVIWSNNTVEFCQNGIDLRTSGHVVSGNTFAFGDYSTQGRCITLRETASDIVFSGNFINDWRFILQIEEDFIGDDFNCENIHFVGNNFTNNTTGFDCEYTGGQNTDLSWRTQPFTNWSFKSNNFSGSASSRHIEIQGYFDGVDIIGNTFDFDSGTANYGVWLGGVHNAFVQSNKFSRSLGILEGNHTVQDNTGSPAVRTPDSNIYSQNIAFNHDSGAFFVSGASTTSKYINGNINIGRDDVVISSGVITAENPYMTVDTEGAASLDDLSTINGMADGQLLTLRSLSNSRDVTLQDGVGNLRLSGDFTLSHADDVISLVYDGPDAAWREVSRSNNGV